MSKTFISVLAHSSYFLSVFENREEVLKLEREKEGSFCLLPQASKKGKWKTSVIKVTAAGREKEEDLVIWAKDEDMGNGDKRVESRSTWGVELKSLLMDWMVE